MGLYSSDKINLVLDGDPVTGWAEDEMIDTNYNDAERIIAKVDATGKPYLSRNNNKTGYLKITLRYGSETNTRLSNLSLTNSIFSWLLVDSSSNSTVAASTASIIKSEPAIVLGKEEKEVVWEIFAMQYTKFLGSNPQNYGA